VAGQAVGWGETMVVIIILIVAVGIAFLLASNIGKNPTNKTDQQLWKSYSYGMSHGLNDKVHAYGEELKRRGYDLSRPAELEAKFAGPSVGMTRTGALMGALNEIKNVLHMFKETVGKKLGANSPKEDIHWYLGYIDAVAITIARLNPAFGDIHQSELIRTSVFMEASRILGKSDEPNGSPSEGEPLLLSVLDTPQAKVGAEMGRLDAEEAASPNPSGQIFRRLVERYNLTI